MRNEVLARVSEEVLSMAPLIFRTIRTKITLKTLTDQELNITPLHFEIMQLLEEKGTMHVSEIGDALQIARAQMTKLIEKMVAMNIVERKTNPGDRRNIDITLTRQAKTILNENKNKISQAFQTLLSSLTDAELDNLSLSFRTLKKLLSEA
jgi:DNA-binding MarR family transcriptional regulator